MKTNEAILRRLSNVHMLYRQELLSQRSQMSESSSPLTHKGTTPVLMRHLFPNTLAVQRVSLPIPLTGKTPHSFDRKDLNAMLGGGGGSEGVVSF